MDYVCRHWTVPEVVESSEVVSSRSLKIIDPESWSRAWLFEMVDYCFGLNFIADGQKGTVYTWTYDGLMVSLGAADIVNLMSF